MKMAIEGSTSSSEAGDLKIDTLLIRLCRDKDV
jgi:hypothetical protein